MERIEQYEHALREVFKGIERVAYSNQCRVLDAFRRFQVREDHFRNVTGYGYGDSGREMLEAIYAAVFGGEDALVRSGIVSGTHALSLCFTALLEKDDEMVSLTGRPYDTLLTVIGKKGNSSSSLIKRGIKYREMPLDDRGQVQPDLISDYVNPDTKLVLIQRSRGYSLRPALGIHEIEELIAAVREVNRQTIIMVDNCYGEFVEDREPCAVGADLTAGSLIKNPGGGLVPGGGYVVGKRELIEIIAERLTAPGLGKEIGPNLIEQRLLFQGLFMAPSVVASALKGAALLALVMQELGYEVNPGPFAERHDIVQAVVLRSPEAVLRFCQTVQSMSPVDSHVRLEYGDMPGYAEPVVMAAGTFVQGSSIELSCDAPMRPPYVAYWQGGLTYEHCKRVVEEIYSQYGAAGF